MRKKEKKTISSLDRGRDPELGNLVFGNSRGEYPLKRGVGFEEELFRLFDAYAPDRDNSWREYGVEFENDTFMVFPYYWAGNCTCGFDNYEFTEKHSENCFLNELEREKLKNGWVKNKYGFLEYPEKDWETMKKSELEIVKELYKKRGWDTKSKNWWHGFAIRCDCDYWERYEKWLKKIGYPNGHKESCLLMKPNFLYKPTGFWIKWYKYPLRDAYTNQVIALQEFKEIIDKCIESVN